MSVMSMGRIIKSHLILVMCEVGMSIKTVIFAANPAGITAMDVDTEKWVIKSTCAHLTGIYNRACRLTKGGKRLEYRQGDRYQEVPADIKSIV